MASQAPPQGHTQIQMQLPAGAPTPTPEQIQAMQRKIAADAAANGMTVSQFIEKLKADAMAQKQAQMQAHAQQQAAAQQQQQQQAQQPITPGPPKPEALAVAKFLKSQDLKPRTCILGGQRKDMFKGLSSIIGLYKL